jgi:hypothetical protein
MSVDAPLNAGCSIRGQGGAFASGFKSPASGPPRRATAVVVPEPEDNSVVRFGYTVGREQTFRIVGKDEADPARGTISHVSRVIH